MAAVRWPRAGGAWPRPDATAGAALLLATALAWLLAVAFPSRTDVRIAVTADGAVARVNDAKLTLQIAPELVPSGGHFGWYVAGPQDSLYFAPADPAAPLAGYGRLAETLQTWRPAARWAPFAAPGLGGRPYLPTAWRPFPVPAGSPGTAAAEDPTSLTYPGAHLYATLVNGRVPAGLFLDLDAAHNGYLFLIRPERRAVAWWLVTAGRPASSLEDAVYRPSLWASLADLDQEAALALTAALALLLLAAALGAACGALMARGQGSGVRGQGSGVGASDDQSKIQKPKLVLSAANGSKIQHFLPVLLVGLAGCGAALAVCLGPLDGIPHVQDDVAYLWQAKIFALGRAWVPAPPQPDFFDQGFILITGGRWFTKYPPGWPLLLAPGVWLGLPWLVPPLCAGGALALIYATGRRLFGPGAAFWAAALGLLSPFFLFMSGSFMSHPATMLLTALALYCFVRLKTGATLFALGTGFALAWAFISREATAVGVAVPFLVWAGVDILGALGGLAGARGDRARWAAASRHVAPYALMVLGALPPLLVLAAVNQTLLGSPFRLAQELVGSYDQLGFGPGFGPEEGGHTPALGLYNALVYGRTLEDVLFGWPLPLTFAPLLAALAAAAGRPWRTARWDLFLLGGFLGLAGVYFAWWSATTIYGPRYWYEALPFLLLLSGRGVQVLGAGAAAVAGRAGPGAARFAGWAVPAVLIGALIVFDLAQVLPGQVRAYTGYNGVDASSLRRVAAAHLDHALVFTALERAAPRRDFGKVFFANDPLLQGPVVYVRDLGAARNTRLLAAFPGRTAYYLPLNGPPHLGVAP